MAGDADDAVEEAWQSWSRQRGSKHATTHTAFAAGRHSATQHSATGITASATNDELREAASAAPISVTIGYVQGSVVNTVSWIFPSDHLPDVIASVTGALGDPVMESMIHLRDAVASGHHAIARSIILSRNDGDNREC